jgi:hypothetical protein
MSAHLLMERQTQSRRPRFFRSAPRSLQPSWPALRSALALALACTGCVSGTKPPRPSALVNVGSGPIDEVNLLATPVALNFDHLPGPDGFVVKIYVGNRSNPKPLSIEKGTLELFMFDGGLAPVNGEAPKPKRAWSFTAADLKQFEIHTSIGVGYQLAPVWGDAKPVHDKIAIVARYTSASGARLSSAPSIISVALK